MPGLALPGRLSAHFPGWASPARRFPPEPITFRPRPSPTRALANTWTYFSEGDSSYNALQVDLNHRFSRGFSLRGVYTWSKTLDDGDSLNATASGNEPALVSNPFDLHADWGLANFDVRNVGRDQPSATRCRSDGTHF